ncbi:MFS transporter [Aureimonas fodinaquatilis]|uniref:MFS transporter n=1 Tax=Aureimonas fodinaquatilis TaxID=2565783 RepID=A0A5B0DSL7_9HYPH|nr:MFS transporter [Aureimonas fodinaquatilis]KAA0969383.1 MFS transporter [Aureimonas fodinaquatilis]
MLSSDQTARPAEQQEAVLPQKGASGFGSAAYALAALSTASFSIGVGEFGIMGLLPGLASDLGVSIPQAGLLVTGYALGVVFGGPLLAAMTSRMERRRLLLAMTVIFIIGNLACALAPTYELLMAARVFTALAHATFFGIGAVMAADISPPGKQAQAISLMFVGMTLANVMGVPLGTFIGQAFGWRSTFWAVTALSVLSGIALMICLPKSYPQADIRFRAELRALTRPQVMLAMSLSVLASIAFFSVFTYITPMLTDVTGLAEATVPYVLLVFGVGLTIGNLAGGKLADWKLMPSIIGLFALLIVILLALYTGMANPALMLGLMFLWGIVVFGLVPPVQMRIVSQATGARNLASTFNQSAFNLGNAIGAWMGAALLTAGFSYRQLPIAALVVAFVALGVAIVSSRMQRRVDSQL